MLAALLATAFVATAPVETTAITAAVEECPDHVGAFTVLDSGHSVVIQGADVDAYAAYDCVRAVLGLPEWTAPLLQRTTATQGLVSVNVGGLTVRWLYDPDSGPVVVIHDVEGAQVASASGRTPADFVADAQVYIASPQFAADSGLPTTFSNVQCAAPVSIAVGSPFICWANAADGSGWQFEVLITDESGGIRVMPPTQLE